LKPKLLRGIRLGQRGGETKNPPAKECSEVSEKLSGKLTSSLAVFYVEQVALNRHVSPQPRLTRLCKKMKGLSRGNRKGPAENLPRQHIGGILRLMYKVEKARNPGRPVLWDSDLRVAKHVSPHRNKVAVL
jgi:hypothetical protein